MTKVELVQINSALATENAELRRLVEGYKLNTRMGQGYVAPKWQDERAKAMAAAKEMAMQCRFVVKV